MEIARDLALNDRFTLQKFSACNQLIAKKYDYRNVYKNFAKIIEEIVK